MSDFSDSVSFGLFAPIGLSAEKSHALKPNEDETTALFQEYRERVIRYLACLGVSLQDGEEIVQEVFILLFQHLRQQKSRQNLRGWIFRVAHNLGLKKRLDLKRQIDTQRWNGPAAASELALADPAPSPEEQMLLKQRHQQMLAALEAMPVQDRSCLYLRAEGLQYREISDVLNISLGNVSQSLARAVKRLNYASCR